MNALKRRHSEDEEEYNYPIKKQRFALYLDDYTPIRTVEVSNLEKNVCAGYLRAYFECKMGPVSNANIVSYKLEESQEIRVGYVTFVIPEDAAKLIFNSNLPQSNYKFTIKQADDAHQPKIDPNALKFEELNDDCLMHIASFLNLIDTINLGKTSSRLRSFAEKEIYPKRTNFTNTADLSINKINLTTILEAMGKFFKSIVWIGLKDRQIDQLTKYCKNVNALTLVAPNLHLNSLERNQLWLQNIESLKIENADFFDAHISAVTTKSSKLKVLQLISCYNVRGSFLSEWKNSNVKYLRIFRCQGLSSSNITDFQRKNELIKFSSDTFDSFVTCLTLPAACLYNYTELELAVNSSTDEKLALLKFEELEQLTKINLRCTFYNHRADSDVTVSNNFNNIFVAMSPIHSLVSLTVTHIIVDADTFHCLGSIPSLREMNLKNIFNAVGQEMYPSLHAHLPKLTKLTMSLVNPNDVDEIDKRSICDMVSELVDLAHFSYSPMSWRLLYMILNFPIKKQAPIEIAVSPMLFYSSKKIAFAAISQGAVKLSLTK